MTVVTPTDRPKSVCNPCVIEVSGGVFVLSIGFRIFCLYRGFCHSTGSDLLFLTVIFSTAAGWIIPPLRKHYQPLLRSVDNVSSGTLA